jgi:myo-inositol-hexaphosphate 3-phosphohydrolase
MATRLEYADPNPTNDLISIPFKITSSQKLTLKVYDASGKEVATVANGQYAAGDYTLL